MLAGTLAAIESDVNENASLRVESGLYLATIDARRTSGATGDSVGQQLLANYVTDMDTSFARWSTELYRADTTSSIAASDSLMNVIGLRMVDDIKRWSDLAGGAPKMVPNPGDTRSGATEASVSIKAVPNPARGRVMLRIIAQDDLQEATLKFYSTSAELVSEMKVGDIRHGKTNFPIDLGTLDAGRYVLVIEHKEGAEFISLDVVR